jgi:hypothetical protein
MLHNNFNPFPNGTFDGGQLMTRGLTGSVVEMTFSILDTILMKSGGQIDTVLQVEQPFQRSDIKKNFFAFNNSVRYSTILKNKCIFLSRWIWFIFNMQENKKNS